MKLNDMSKEEIEQLSFTDLSKMILQENKKPMNTPNLFKKICGLLDYSETDYENKIGNFYTLLTTDKDFILLDDGTWDLRDHHPVKMLLDEDEIEDESIEEEIEEEESLEDEQIDEIVEDNLDDDDEDDDELMIIEEEYE